MIIEEFENELKEIHPDLHIRKTQKDLAGVYFKDRYVGVSVPPNHIFDLVKKEYCDAFGSPYKSRKIAKLLVRLRYTKC